MLSVVVDQLRRKVRDDQHVGSHDIAKQLYGHQPSNTSRRFEKAQYFVIQSSLFDDENVNSTIEIIWNLSNQTYLR